MAGEGFEGGDRFRRIRGPEGGEAPEDPGAPALFSGRVPQDSRPFPEEFVRHSLEGGQSPRIPGRGRGPEEGKEIHKPFLGPEARKAERESEESTEEDLQIRFPPSRRETPAPRTTLPAR